MNTRIVFRGLFIPTFLLVFANAFGATSASNNVYWTRGFDGTGMFNETTTNKVFIEDGGTVFSDRLVSGANTIAEIDALGILNAETGARTDESVTADYAGDGSVYLHIGYINSGFTGSGSEIQNVDLNGDLVIGRLGIENSYDRGGETKKNTNIATVMSAGDSDYSLIFDYTGTADQLVFFRKNGGLLDTYATTFTFDCNVKVTNGSVGGDYLFSSSSNNHLVFGSVDHQRTLTFEDSGNYEVNLFYLGGLASVTVYSDMIVNGGGRYVFRGLGSYYVEGNVSWNVKNSPGYMSFMTLSGDSSTGYAAGEAVLNGNLAVDISNSSSSMDIFYLGRAGNSVTVNGAINVKGMVSEAGGVSLFITKVADQTITVNNSINIDKLSAKTTSRVFCLNGSEGRINVNGKITINDTGTAAFFVYDDSPTSGGGNTITSKGDIEINSITSSDFEVIRMGGENGTAVFDGDLYINNKTANTSTAYGYRVYDKSGLSLTINGNVNLNGKYKGYILSVGGGASDSVVNMYGNISIMDSVSTTSLFYNNSLSTPINFYGDITITSNVSSTTLLGGARANGSVTNFYGKLDSTVRTAETSFSATNNGSIINFRGLVDNTFNNLGLRSSIYNLLNTNNSSALNIQTYLGFGSKARVNVFGQNQLKLASQAEIYLWGASEGVSGTINLNGSSLEIGGIYFVGASRRLEVDFGMSDHGMTNEQLEALGITSEMINATGAGVSQVFSIGGVRFRDDTSLNDCYILLKDYVVGEDRVLSYVKLSELSINGTIAYSDSVLENNLFRVEGYTDSEKYGVDYYLAEVETTDAYGAPCWEYYIIPEPADIAALIGVLALGFAFLRRKRA